MKQEGVSECAHPPCLYGGKLMLPGWRGVASVDQMVGLGDLVVDGDGVVRVILGNKTLRQKLEVGSVSALPVGTMVARSVGGVSVTTEEMARLGESYGVCVSGSCPVARDLALMNIASRTARLVARGGRIACGVSVIVGAAAASAEDVRVAVMAIEGMLASGLVAGFYPRLESLAEGRALLDGRGALECRQRLSDLVVERRLGQAMGGLGFILTSVSPLVSR